MLNELRFLKLLISRSYSQKGASIISKPSSFTFLVADVGCHLDRTCAISWNTYMWPLCVAWGSFLMALKFKGMLPKQKELDGSCIVFYDLTWEVLFLKSSQRITTFKGKRPSTN